MVGNRKAIAMPGDQAARRSRLVVSNGGSSTGYQALAEGVPVLGLASNLDQLLAMNHIEKAGCGKLLRASTVSVEAIRRAARRLIASDTHHVRAREVAADFRRWTFAPRFRSVLAEVLGRGDEPAHATPPRRAAPAIAIALVVGTQLASLPARAESDAPRQPSSNEIRFAVTTPSPEGHVICALFKKVGWLKQPVAWQKIAIQDNQAECVFASVAADSYAVSAFHDVNDNSRLDTNFIGIPTESWCTSRNARAWFGPPSFEDAKFRYAGGVLRLHGALR